MVAIFSRELGKWSELFLPDFTPFRIFSMPARAPLLRRYASSVVDLSRGPSTSQLFRGTVEKSYRIPPFGHAATLYGFSVI